MSLHVYFCHLSYYVTVGQSWDPPDPGESYMPCEMIVAETRGRAKAIFMREDKAVDDYISIRTNCVARHVDDVLGWDDGEYVRPAEEGVLRQPRVDPPEPGESWDPKVPARDRLWYDCWARVAEIDMERAGTHVISFPREAA